VTQRIAGRVEKGLRDLAKVDENNEEGKAIKVNQLPSELERMNDHGNVKNQ
jgi:hypothetical protein